MRRCAVRIKCPILLRAGEPRTSVAISASVQGRAKSVANTSFTLSTNRCRPRVAPAACVVRGPSARCTRVKVKVSASRGSAIFWRRLCRNNAASVWVRASIRKRCCRNESVSPSHRNAVDASSRRTVLAERFLSTFRKRERSASRGESLTRLFLLFSGRMSSSAMEDCSNPPKPCRSPLIRTQGFGHALGRVPLLRGVPLSSFQNAVDGAHPRPQF
jgi:hypothetical protein